MMVNKAIYTWSLFWCVKDNRDAVANLLWVIFVFFRKKELCRSSVYKTEKCTGVNDIISSHIKLLFLSRTNIISFLFIKLWLCFKVEASSVKYFYSYKTRFVIFATTRYSLWNNKVQRETSIKINSLIFLNSSSSFAAYTFRNYLFLALLEYSY